MAKECIEYKLHRNDRGNLTTPSWMSEGGYYQAADKSMVGFVPVEGEREWYVPDSAAVLNQAEFVARGMLIHSANKFQKTGANSMDMTPMTTAEANQMLTAFYQSKVAE
jgi:hypothetical protein